MLHIFYFAKESEWLTVMSYRRPMDIDLVQRMDGSSSSLKKLLSQMNSGFLVIFGISRANWKQLKDITHLINASLICHVDVFCMYIL